jgi:O-antigen/teichoic acid export membrane protein
MRRLFRMSLPLAGTLVLGGLIGNVPIYALQHWRDSSDVGVLAVQMRLLLAAGLCFGALVDVGTPRLARYHAAREPAFRRLALKLLLVGVGNGAALVLGTALAGDTVLRLVYGQAYADGGLALMLAVSTTANLLCQVLLTVAAATHRFRIAFRAAVGQLVVTVGLSVTLVAHRGLWGAGVALLAGQCCCLAMLVAGTTRFLRKRYWERRAAMVSPSLVPPQRSAPPEPTGLRAPTRANVADSSETFSYRETR